ncbi:MAG: SDR family NAD(P)-dependent oxidoreductase [Acidimicrobiia bacterium]
MVPSFFDLTGHVALVTGGNSGVGIGLAQGLVQAGATVRIWGTNPQKNDAAVAELSTFGPNVSAAIVDVSDEEAVRAAMAALVGDLGKIDSCFANAGISGLFANPSFLDSTVDEWRRMLAVNVEGTYVTLREAARYMVERGEGGSLVATASLAGVEFGAPRDEAYAVTKAGIVGLTKSLAVTFGKHGIRANALLPGWTMSPQTEAWAQHDRVAERIMARIPLRRWGQPEDWAGIAVYLASNASSFHTGDTFRLDGGYSVF